MADHPKTKIYNYIAKNEGNPFSAQIRIVSVDYDHRHQLANNSNIFTCIVKYVLDSEEHEIRSEECLTKKDAEKNAFDNVYSSLQKKIRYKAIGKQNCFSVKELENNILFSSLVSKTASKSTSRSSSKSTSSSKSSKSSKSRKRVRKHDDMNFDWNDIDKSKDTKDNENNNKSELQPELSLLSSPCVSLATTSASTTTSPLVSTNRKNKTEWKNDISKTDMREQIVVIVDYENISKQSEITKLTAFLEAIYMKSNISSNLIKVAGFCSNVKNTADIIVRSNRGDAVDHYISYLTGKLESSENPPKKIYVISRDKFGSCLQDFCNNVDHCSDVDDFIDIYGMNV